MNYKQNEDVIKLVFDRHNIRKDKKKVLTVTKDPILNLLNYFTIHSHLKNLIRTEYDLDSVHIYNTEAKEKGTKRFRYSLNADIMISFFTPYARAIEIVTGKKYYKGNYNDLIELIEKENDDEYKEVNKHFKKFAKLYATRGNIIILPEGHHDMNRKRYYISQDKIEKTLYECFSGGKLSINFKNDEELKSWIREENMDICFENKNIEREQIIGSLKYYLKYIKFSEIKNEKEIYLYIDLITEIIEYRNSKFSNKSNRH